MRRQGARGYSPRPRRPPAEHTDVLKMHVQDDTIVIDSRYEIDDIQRIIAVFEKSGEKLDVLQPADLESLRRALNRLYMTW